MMCLDVTLSRRMCRIARCSVKVTLLTSKNVFEPSSAVSTKSHIVFGPDELFPFLLRESLPTKRCFFDDGALAALWGASIMSAPCILDMTSVQKSRESGCSLHSFASGIRMSRYISTSTSCTLTTPDPWDAKSTCTCKGRSRC